VHKCIKILAKRKRGNKFAYACIRNFGQERDKARQGTKMETNPSLLEGFLGRVLHRRKEEIGSMNM